MIAAATKLSINVKIATPILCNARLFSKGFVVCSMQSYSIPYVVTSTIYYTYDSIFCPLSMMAHDDTSKLNDDLQVFSLHFKDSDKFGQFVCFHRLTWCLHVFYQTRSGMVR